MMASIAVMARYVAVSPPATGATTEADITAMVELVVTLAWRLVPRIAYAVSPAVAVMRPIPAGTPASSAYAMATGTITAQEVMPAVMSLPSQARG